VPGTRGVVEAPRRRRLRDRHLKLADIALVLGMLSIAILAAWAHALITVGVQILCALVVVVVGLATSE